MASKGESIIWFADGSYMALDASGNWGYFTKANVEMFYITQAGAIVSVAGASIGGKLTSYNGVALAALGLPAIVAEADITGKTAAATICSYTPTANYQTFFVAGYLNITTSSTESITITVTFTDEAANSRTVTILSAQTTAGFFPATPALIRAATATAVSVQTAGTFTSVTYDAGAAIVQIA
jgi:hypothetical protein